MNQCYKHLVVFLLPSQVAVGKTDAKVAVASGASPGGKGKNKKGKQQQSSRPPPAVTETNRVIEVLGSSTKLFCFVFFLVLLVQCFIYKLLGSTVEFLKRLTVFGTNVVINFLFFTNN